jgi:hypothetical protein
MIRVAEEVLPGEISGVRNMNPEEWRRFSVGLQSSSEMGDRLLGLFGKDFAPRINELVLDIQDASQSVASSYALWPELLGVPAEKLPRRRDGSSSLPTQQAWYKLVERDSVKLLKLCGELLRNLDDLPSNSED